MAIWAVFSLSVILSSFISASVSTPTSIPSKNQDLLKSIEEMQRENYYAFVMLINMSPSHRIPGNITFLMPNDRTLAKTVIQGDTVLDFLLKHSIPSPLLFDYLEHFPSGSIIPSSMPDFPLKISNDGRRRFFLNNVKITRPNICVSTSSIRCHGIDGVLVDTDVVVLPSIPCNATNAPPISGGMAPPAAGVAVASVAAPSQAGGSWDTGMAPASSAPQPGYPEGNPRHSGSTRWVFNMGFCVALSVLLALSHVV